MTLEDTRRRKEMREASDYKVRLTLDSPDTFSKEEVVDAVNLFQHRGDQLTKVISCIELRPTIDSHSCLAILEKEYTALRWKLNSLFNRKHELLNNEFENRKQIMMFA